MAESFNAEQTFAAALGHHKAGQLSDAERLYRLILSRNPRQPEALHMLGVLAHQAGQNGPAEDLIRQAISVQPSVAGYHGNLGMVLAAKGKLDEAIASYRNSVELQPQYPDAYNNLASLLIDASQFEAAIDACRKALALKPQIAAAHYNLGAALRGKGNLSGAASAFHAATLAKPGYAEAHNSLGDMLAKQGQTEQAIASFRQAITARPAYPEAFNNLGNAYRDLHQLRAAAAAYQSALLIRADDAVVLNNLGTLLEGLPESAEQCIEVYQRALAAQPNLAAAHYNLGNALRKLGRVGEAVDQYRQALAIKREPATAANLLYTIHFHDDYGPIEIAREHADWNRAWVQPLAHLRAIHSNDRTPDRVLRIGYVSPDFRDHPIGRFILPLLSKHNRELFKIYCYSDVRRETELTQSIKTHAEVWRDSSNHSDADLADQIRRDGIDILVDLTMHMEGSRMLAFARKPAPVQVTYLAYCSTTGSETIDYRLTDSLFDPPDLGDGHYPEKPVRLNSYWCYAPPLEAPAVGPSPASITGHITFGCLNNVSKVSPRAIDTWARLLHEVPGSRLTLHTLAGMHHHSLIDRFVRDGIERDRIELIGFLSTRDYLNLYNRIDIALDPFPYPGGTTTLDALWMGVPVVSLAGRTSVSRGGLSILANLGCNQWVAGNTHQYISIAKSLAGDLPMLSRMRSELRARLQASILMDASAFARDVEGLYRQMWHTWCTKTFAINEDH
jgi:protein O-GlcNAc transferase